MPSVVRVTNLDNGKSLVVRINDRGPYVSGRIIDMSRAGARLLGFKDEGIARVRVQVLTEQSLRLEQLAKQGQFPLLAEAAKAPVPETVAVSKPAVSLRAKTTRAAAQKPKSGSSAVELLASSRGLGVLKQHLLKQIFGCRSARFTAKQMPRICCRHSIRSARVQFFRSAGMGVCYTGPGLGR